jgi:hypothetical protein
VLLRRQARTTVLRLPLVPHPSSHRRNALSTPLEIAPINADYCQCHQDPGANLGPLA